MSTFCSLFSFSVSLERQNPVDNKLASRKHMTESRLLFIKLRLFLPFPILFLYVVTTAIHFKTISIAIYSYFIYLDQEAYLAAIFSSKTSFFFYANKFLMTRITKLH